MKHHRRRLGQGWRRQVDDGGQPGALGLAANGVATGLLDADIYGPSMPRMLDVKDKPESIDGKGPEADRGATAHHVDWLHRRRGYADDLGAARWCRARSADAARRPSGGELDVLVVDMPPGTGDVHARSTWHLAGAVIVSTPQDIALVDAAGTQHVSQRWRCLSLGFVERT